MRLALSFACCMLLAEAFLPAQPLLATPSLDATSTQLFNKKKSTQKKSSAARAKPQGFAGAIRDLQINTFPYAGEIRPGSQSPQRVVLEEGIARPDYADDGTVRALSVFVDRCSLC
jgi:hypothetical protein